MTVHSAQLCATSTVLFPHWLDKFKQQWRALTWRTGIMEQHLWPYVNTGTDCTLCQPLRDFHWLGIFGNVFLQQGPGGWHKWDLQRNTKQIRGAPASAVPLLGDHAARWKQTSVVLWEEADCVSAGVVVVKEDAVQNKAQGLRLMSQWNKEWFSSWLRACVV